VELFVRNSKEELNFHWNPLRRWKRHWC